MLKIRKIKKEEKEQLNNLIAVIETSIKNKSWWLPINQLAKEHFFDDDWTVFFGLFDDNRLVGASALFLNEHEYGESLKQLSNITFPVAEIGRSMIHPEYRGNNLLYRINKEIINYAKLKKIKTIIVTIHPDNISSIKSFNLLGVKLASKITKNESFRRNIYTLNL